MKIKFIILIIAGLCIRGYSQYRTLNYKQIEEWIGLGSSSYSGDIGSKFTTVLPSFDIGLRYFMNNYIALNGHFTYAALKGNDQIINNNRGYSFNTHLGEISVNFEMYLFKTGSKFNRYSSYKGTGSRKKFNFYCSVGAGAIAFLPTGYSNGEPTDLSNVYYDKTSYIIPLGGGIRYKINKKWFINLHFKESFTITDYLDDYSSDNNDKDRYFVSMISLIHKFNKYRY